MAGRYRANEFPDTPDLELTRSQVLRWGIGLVAGAAIAGCDRGEPTDHAALPTDGSEISLDELVRKAKREGRLNLIALPPDWVNYGEIISTFRKKYGLTVTVASPNATGAQENAAIEEFTDSRRAPDCVDLGLTIAQVGASRGLYAAYKNSKWDTIPDKFKEASGLWVADYWGILSIGSNRQQVRTPPRSMQDLLKSDYKGKIALYGNPLSTGSAFAAVWAAALANGGSLDDIRPGVEFWAELKRSGNYIPVQATPATIANGQTPITLDLDYLHLAYRAEVADRVDWDVNVPTDARYANHACQAISKSAPNPFAARLWQEFLYSDEGQLLWLKGFAHTARFDDLSRRDVIPRKIAEQLPAGRAYTDAQFPSAEQTDKATKVLAAEWPEKVG